MSGFIGGDQPYRSGTQEAELALTAKFPYKIGSGSCLHFRDTTGHLLVCFTKRKVQLDVGDRIRASFVVKSHHDYENSQQNIVNKFKILEWLSSGD